MNHIMLIIFFIKNSFFFLTFFFFLKYYVVYLHSLFSYGYKQQSFIKKLIRKLKIVPLS